MFWIGEYAVLFGGPAIVAAVDRYAFAEANLVHDDASSTDLQVSSSISDEKALLDPVRGLEDYGSDWSLLQAVFEALRAAFPGWNPPSGNIHFDSSPLSAEEKLGLGSSGAVAVLAVSLLGGNRINDRQRLQELAFDAHRRFQGGVGSGGDIIASTWGGLQMIHENDRKAIGIPEDLHVAALYSGTDARTSVLVQEVKQARLEDSNVKAILRKMAECAALGVEALDDKRTQQWLACIERFHELEIELTRASGAPIVSDAVQACVDLANEVGCVAKASGAGGGDVIVAFSDNDADLKMLRTSVEGHPTITFIPLGIDKYGMSSCSRPESTRSADH
jgi:phosphomevalonate kinase